jgi:hypothetical protein
VFIDDVDLAVGGHLVNPPVEHDHFAIQMIEGAQAEIAMLDGFAQREFSPRKCLQPAR